MWADERPDITKLIGALLQVLVANTLKIQTINMIWTHPQNGRQQMYQASARVDATRKKEEMKRLHDAIAERGLKEGSGCIQRNGEWQRQ
jgi:hypothetical protein